jgi:hypothetical protein
VRDRLRFDPVCLGAGAALIGVGALIVLDSSGALSVPPGWMAVALTAAVGVILLLSGLVDRAPKRQD